MTRTELEKAIEQKTGKTFKHNTIELLTRTLYLGRLSVGKTVYLTDKNVLTVVKENATSFYYTDILNISDII